MNYLHFIKKKNFKINLTSTEFMDARFMSKEEKFKTYKDMNKFLNNHFKQTLFSKRLYNHFCQHCGFIAHYNQGGFYGEYFSTPARFHYNVNNFKNKAYECGGELNISSDMSDNEQFYSIYQELKNKKNENGLCEFYETIMQNQNWGAYSEYRDLDDAIKNLFNDYMKEWEHEIRVAKGKYSLFVQKEESKKLLEKKREAKLKRSLLNRKEIEIEEALSELVKTENKEESREAKELNLFDFMVA